MIEAIPFISRAPGKHSHEYSLNSGFANPIHISFTDIAVALRNFDRNEWWLSTTSCNVYQLVTSFFYGNTHAPTGIASWKHYIDFSHRRIN